MTARLTFEDVLQYKKQENKDMTFSIFINFDGNCRGAVEFYANAFRTKPNIMTYGEAPDGNVEEKDKELIMYADLMIGDCNVMFMDYPTGTEYIQGNSIQPTLSLDDKEEVERLFDALKVGGIVGMELQETFWSKLYGMVIDQFGIQWHIMYNDGQYGG